MGSCWYLCVLSSNDYTSYMRELLFKVAVTMTLNPLKPKLTVPASLSLQVLHCLHWVIYERMHVPVQWCILCVFIRTNFSFAWVNHYVWGGNGVSAATEHASLSPLKTGGRSSSPYVTCLFLLMSFGFVGETLKRDFQSIALPHFGNKKGCWTV